jgi:hypothetical protein
MGIICNGTRSALAARLRTSPRMISSSPVRIIRQRSGARLMKLRCIGGQASRRVGLKSLL